jgi:hypothetical protein
MYVNKGLGAVDIGQFCAGRTYAWWNPFDWIAYDTCAPFIVAGKAAQATGYVKTDVTQPLPTPPPAAPAGAPQTVEQMTEAGTWTPEMSAESSMATSRQQWADFFNRIAAQQQPPAGPDDPCSHWYSFLNPACPSGPSIGTWLLIGGAAFLGFQVFLSISDRVIGGRR